MNNTIYTATVAVQLIPTGLRPVNTYWAHPVYQIEEEASWFGYGRVIMAALAQAKLQYGTRMNDDTSYVMEISPKPE